MHETANAVEVFYAENTEESSLGEDGCSVCAGGDENGDETEREP